MLVEPGTIAPASTPTQDINFDTLRTDIVNNDILPTVKNDIDNSYLWRTRWNFLSNVSNISVQLLTGLSSIFSFIATSSSNTKYSFIAGIFSVVTLFLTNFAIYSSKQKRDKTIEINKYLQKLNIKFSMPNSDETEDKKD
jgi:hypothetical protein